jgi:histidinol-phosphate aminotransferase
VRLNANEAPWTTQLDGHGFALNRYPEIRPRLLQARLAERYGVLPDRLLVTRGSSEAIDLLLRAFCRPGVDNVVVTPPTFSMYRVYAEIQGAGVRSVPLLAENDFELDVDAVLESCDARTKLIFACSPNNPTGNLFPAAKPLALAGARSGQSLVVVDEAYVEFSGTESLAARSDLPDNVVVLRTLSKALALAGARCGAVIGCERLIGLLNGVLAPYALATPVIDCVLAALDRRNEVESRQACTGIVQERERLSRALAGNRKVVKVWPSRANFLLVKFQDLAAIQDLLRTHGVLIRDFPGDGALGDCARITVGSRAENDQLLLLLSQG